MIQKMKLSAVVLGLAALAGADFAAACSTAQWGQGSPPGGGVVAGAAAGSPTTANSQSFRRYAGLCGLRANASGQYVQDGTPATAESRYIASFYVYPAAGANTNVFTMMADETTDYAIVTVRHTGTGFVFVNRNGTASTEITAAPNRWYQIHLDWSRAASTLDVSVKGNAGATNQNTTQLTGFTLADPGDGPDYVQLGWVSGGTTGLVNVDAFESRRATAIPKLCRGDANNSFITSSGTTGITVGDAITVANEATSLGAASPTYGLGQTDCTEDGSISVADAICVSNRAVIANVCTAQP